MEGWVFGGRGGVEEVGGGRGPEGELVVRGQRVGRLNGYSGGSYI